MSNLALRISVQSTEYVRIPVSARSSGVWVNPTSDVVAMALPYRGKVTDTPEIPVLLSGELVFF